MLVRGILGFVMGGVTTAALSAAGYSDEVIFLVCVVVGIVIGLV